MAESNVQVTRFSLEFLYFSSLTRRQETKVAILIDRLHHIIVNSIINKVFASKLKCESDERVLELIFGL